ncbi:MAG: exodeoxyribonuclease III [Pseudomonadota bacterium]
MPEITPSTPLRIVSWNVNGLRACAKKGFADFLQSSGADVVCLQEVRAFPGQLPDEIRAPKGWHTFFHAAERPGYSGVAIYSRRMPERISTTLGEEIFDIEGRYIEVRFGRLTLASVYFPKGSGRERDNSRVPYKLAFTDAVFRRAAQCRRYGPTLIAGDYNTAPAEIDLARPAGNRNNSGFLPEERGKLNELIRAGWVDSFRQRHRNEPGHYTWWRQFGGAREKNVGWRIDYFLASPSADRAVTQAFVWPDVTGSDHCPVGVDLRLRAGVVGETPHIAQES